MKNILQITVVMALMVLSTNAFTKGSSTILLSEQFGSYSIDFLNEDRVTSLQFDVVFDGINNKNLKAVPLKSCVSGLPKTHVGLCKVKNNRLRVLVYSQTNAILESGNIGSFRLGKKNNNLGIKITSIVMGTPELKEIKGEVILDLSFEQQRETQGIIK